MRNQAVDKWDERFLALAEQVASWSKDPSTKVGAVIVRDNRIIATGYNGLPKLVEDSPERYQRPSKLLWVCHAEVNAVFDAAMRGTATAGATLYSTLFPCAQCAAGIVQAGIERVVTRAVDERMTLWADSFAAAKQMFTEAGMRVTIVTTEA